MYARSKLSVMQDKLAGIWEAIDALATAPGFEGAAASKAKGYLSDVHGLLYSSIQTVLSEYQQLLLVYKDGWHSGVDSNAHAEFDEERLAGVESAMSARARDFEAQAAELESAVGAVSDLLTFFGPRNAASVAADIRQAGSLARQVREAVGEYEHAHGRDLVPVRDQMARIRVVLDRYAGGHGSVGYDPGSLASDPAVVAVFAGLQEMQAGQGERAPAMEGVYAREEDRVAVLDAEAAAERAKWGWIKAVGAVVTIAVGVVVLVASAGAATPLLVVAAAGAATVFGASDLVEAGQDIYYGSRGDAYTQAFNPLREWVFGGNQTLYDVAGFVVCAVASAGIPLSQAAKLGTLTRGTVVRAAVREGVEDLATQKLAEVATPHLGAEGALAASVVAGGGMGRLGGGPAKAPGAHGAPVLPPAGRISGPDSRDLGKSPVGSYGGYGMRPPRSDQVRTWAWADRTYDELRRDPALADDIADSTGWPRERVRRVINHLLHDEHLIEDYETGSTVRRVFDAEPNQAEALLRLRSGVGTPEDILLLKHEWAESEYLLAHPGAKYEEAHLHANAVADWWSSVQLRGDG